MDLINNLLGSFMPQASAGTATAQNNEAPVAPQSTATSAPRVSREDLQAIFADPEVAKAIKQASKDGMKEGYVELMKKFMAKLPQLIAPMLSIGSGADPIAAFSKFTGGLINAFDDIVGSKKPEAPQTVVEGKPTADSSQATDMMKMLQQAFTQTAA